MILYVNACVRKESRTNRIAQKIISKYDGPVEEVRLSDISFPAVDEDFLTKRDQLIAEGEFNDPLLDFARQFSRADVIIIAAPYWDLSFPASLKQYLEQVNVVGITFRYNEQGIPEGMCKATKLVYVMTAGGPFAPEEFGFGYVKALANNYYGIEDCELVKALGLDIVGADVEGIMQEVLSTI